MEVDKNSQIAMEYDHFKLYYRDFCNYINQQKMAFPMNYTEFIQSRNRDIVDNLKK